MHRLQAWSLLGLLTLLPGCAMTQNFCHNVAIDPLHYEPYSDSFWSKIRNCRLADDAWTRAQEMAPQPYTRHYARGFKNGYMNYLRGGDGNDALVPPRRYWAFFYQSPEGNEAIQDWFAGWRHGTAMAKESGYLNLYYIPTIYSPESAAPVPTDRKTGEPLGTEQLPQRPAIVPGGAKPTDAKPGDAKPGDAKPGDAKPSDAQPVDPNKRPSDKPGDAPPPIAPPKPGDPPKPTDPPKKPNEPPKASDEPEEYQSLVTPAKR